MATKIEWTDQTWNPVIGCSKVSQGCKFCYAERIFPRAYGNERKFTDVVLHPERLGHPHRWRKPQRVFVNSMSDLFHEDVPFEFVDKVFAVMALVHWHTFQIITKRPERMLKFFSEVIEGHVGDRVAFLMDQPDWLQLPRGRAFNRTFAEWPLSNVWLGVSVENQQTADERIPKLLNTPAAGRFVSYEPALAPVDLQAIQMPDGDQLGNSLYNIGTDSGIDWVIAGGESGPSARPSHTDWFRLVRDQCVKAGVPFFFKQWGEWLGAEQDGLTTLNCTKESIRVGKKAAGRNLDGREWNEFPVTK
jgi:protein gp37